MKFTALLFALFVACTARGENAIGTEIPVNTEAASIEGRPISSVAITQCSLLVAVYVTMPDGKLVRFDMSSNIPAPDLLTMAYTAIRSERIEIGCDGGDFKIERHGPV